MITWHIGGAFTFKEELLKTGIKNLTVFGTIPGLAWNGGRLVENSMSLEEAAIAIKEYNNKGISVNVTFTNTCSINLLDVNCNAMLRLLSENADNGVIVASKKLHAYVSKHYPNLQIVASICFVDSSEDFLKWASTSCSTVAVNPDYNRQVDKLQGLDIQKAQVLVNEWCHTGCQERKQHYDILSANINNTEYRDWCICSTPSEEHCPLWLSHEEIIGLIQKGVRHFKIQGRHIPEFNSEVGMWIDKLKDIMELVQ